MSPATRAGRAPATAVTRSATRWAQFVFAGVGPRDEDYFGTEDGAGGSALAFVVALAGLGTLG